MQLQREKPSEQPYEQPKLMTDAELMELKVKNRKNDIVWYRNLVAGSGGTWDVYERFLSRMSIDDVTSFITNTMRQLHQEYYYERNLTRGSAPLLFTHGNNKFVPSLPELVLDILERYPALDKKLLLSVAKSNKKGDTAEAIEWFIKKSQKVTVIDDNGPADRAPCYNPFAFLNSRAATTDQQPQATGAESPQQGEESKCVVM